MLIGYARVSTDRQDLTAQRHALLSLGVDDTRIYTDQGLSGRNRDRPGLAQAIAACRAGDTLVVTKLDWLARSATDAAAIAAELANRKVALNLGGAIYDPTDPVGKLIHDTGDGRRVRSRSHFGPYAGGYGHRPGTGQAQRPAA